MEIDEDVIPASPPPPEVVDVGRKKRRKRRKVAKEDDGSLGTCADSTSKSVSQTEPSVYDGIDLDSEIAAPEIPPDFDILENVRVNETLVDAVEARPRPWPQTQPGEFVTAIDYILSQNEELPEKEHHSEDIMGLQFSEWILPTQAAKSPANAVKSPTACSAVEKILEDFNADSMHSEDSVERSPPLLVVKRQRAHRTYAHKRRQVRAVPSKNEAAKSPVSEPDIENVNIDTQAGQVDIEIDLNMSRMIVENLNNLSAFFTQSETISFDLEQSIISQENLIETADQDGGRCEEMANEICDIEKHLLNDDDDIFADIKSPHGIQILRGQKRKVSPLVAKDDLSLTPTLAKLSKSVTFREFLQPKKLKFDADGIGDSKPSCSFAVPKPPGIFDDIFDEFKGLENGIDQMDGFVGFKSANSKNINIPTAPKKSVKWSDSTKDQTPHTNGFNGFKTAAGNKLLASENSLQKSAGIFDDIMNEFKMDQSDDNAGLSDFKMSTLGFSKASSSKAESDFDLGNNESAMESPIAVRAKFATSTPNPSRASVLMKSLAITPIARPKEPRNGDSVQESLDFLRELEDNSFNDLFSDFPTRSQLIRKPTAQAQKGVPAVPQDVKIRRREALARQSADCLRKSEVQPRPGIFYNQKKLPEKKKLKSLGTPRLHSAEELMQKGMQRDAIEINSVNALDFKFNARLHYPLEICEQNVDGIELEDGIRLLMDENAQIGLPEICSAFLQCASVDTRLIPDNWLANAVKWIIVKLVSYERSFPDAFAGRALTPGNVLRQLKLRYDREIDQAMRSAIRKIVEQDDVASKRMVLFVSFVMRTNPVEYALELCDGWYSIRTTFVDEVLCRAIQSGKISVGTKLMIQSAVLVGAEEGCSPLEMPGSIALQISANSTRRTRWYAKLGFSRKPSPISMSFNSIEPSGGFIARTRVHVSRVYPLLYYVKAPKDENGELNASKGVFRSEKVEQKCNRLNDRKRFEQIEELYNSLSEEVSKELDARRDTSKMSSFNHRNVSEIQDAEDLWHLLETSNDAAAIEEELSATQKRLVTDYQQKMYDKKMNEISRRARERIESDHFNTATPLLRLRVVDAISANRTGVVTIWNAGESSAEIKENTVIEITNCTATGARGRDVMLSTNNRTAIRTLSIRPFSPSHEATRRRCVRLDEIAAADFQPVFKELDTVAYILSVEPITVDTKFHSVYAVDDSGNVLRIKFWNNLSDYAYDDVVQEGRFVAMQNLDWRPANARRHDGVIQVFVTEITMFTERPRSSEAINALKNLRDSFEALPDLNVYLGECLARLNCIPTNNGSTSSADMSSNRNVTATATTSTAMNGRRTQAQIRMDKLKKLGEAPPPPALIINQSASMALRRPFKVPMVTGIDTNHHKTKNQENRV